MSCDHVTAMGRILIGGARLRGCGNVTGVLCPKLPCDRCEMRSALSRCLVLSNLITTVLVARQDGGCRITRARRTYIHIRTQSRARARAVRTQPPSTTTNVTRSHTWHIFVPLCPRGGDTDNLAMSACDLPSQTCQKPQKALKTRMYLQPDKSGVVRTLVRRVRTLSQKRILFSQVRTVRTSERAQMGKFGAEFRQSGRRSSFQTNSRGCHVALTSTPTRGLGTAVKYRSCTRASLACPDRRTLRRNLCGTRNASEADATARCWTDPASGCMARLTQTRGLRAGIPLFVDGAASVATTAREQPSFILVTWPIRSSQRRWFQLSSVGVGGAPRKLCGAPERAGPRPLERQAQEKPQRDSSTPSSAPGSMKNCGAGPLVR